MKIVPLEFSIVVVGEDCNPTILNPDFLKYQQIVPEEWEWELAAAPLTTRGISVVAYTSGIMLKVEPNRFQVTEVNQCSDITDSKAISIARRYVEVLPHVKYTAVGTNFRGFSQIENPNEFLKARFIKPGPWDQQPLDLKAVTLSFAYAHEDARLTLALEGRVILHQQEEQTQQIFGVDISGNYHRECHGYPTNDMVLAHIAKAKSDAAHFGTMADELLFAGAS
ncbi:hypothetical protein SAMN05421783_1107 [Thiocapsa roseopersicina]|uniref:Uncharacterized protein n=2 Tax=Thiocapsa roseopersicina TaxID=1058 RepID=A0A1H2X4B4_THIRO|nr:hypothetical protein SAMN05421783_1107 [Thiocapsa roseopersicina]